MSKTMRDRTCLLLAILACFFFVASTATYNVGVGIADVTGTAAEIGMMGYAMLNQKANGLHFRQRARAYIIEDTEGHRVVYLSSDICMIFQEVKMKVISLLRQKFGSLYTDKNVLIHGTHTHAGPAGFAHYLLYDITSFGFIRDNYDVIVKGLFEAIVMAHYNIRPARIYANRGLLLDTNINRSPTAYRMNPSEERANYDYDVDKLMTVWKFVDQQTNESFAALSWFSVHGTSMNNTNGLISGDNKGYAAYLFERFMNGNDSAPGVGPFIAAFPQSNEGDVSPNTKGAFCPDGTPCGDTVHSTCNGKTQGCIATGPGNTDMESCEIIGRRQYERALELFREASEELTGPIGYVHQYVDMQHVRVNPRWTGNKKEGFTCTAALGDSFAGGTTDGPGAFDFRQGSNSTKDNPFFNFIAKFLSNPTKEEKTCQAPKPILLNVGRINVGGVAWVQTSLPIQMFRIGQYLITGVPGEFTTMSGRRLRNAIVTALAEHSVSPANTDYIVIAGLANAYSHYIATYHEYQQQRYEAASTMFGPHTLAAYEQSYYQLTHYLVNGTEAPTGPVPEPITKTITLVPPVVLDEPPKGKKFGEVALAPLDKYRSGETVVVQFWGANPRNNLRVNGTYFTVERQVNDKWVPFLTDAHWETKYRWKRSGLAASLVTIEWTIASYSPAGTYRIRYFGDSRSATQRITPFEGVSQPFVVSTN